MKKEKKIGQQVCGYVVVVNNSREVFGHDDSLPYNAEFEIFNKTAGKICQGKAWNDGWGGPSSYSIDDECDKELAHKAIDEIDKYGDTTFFYRYKDLVIHVRFMDIVDYLVDFSIDGGANCGKVFSENALIKYLENN